MMEQHCAEKHRATDMLTFHYRPCQVQRLFATLGHSYFHIGRNVMAGARPNVETALQATFLPGFEARCGIEHNTTDDDVMPHVRLMGWDKFEVELRVNPTQRQAADDIKKMHTETECGGILMRLSATVRDHMARASTILDEHPHRLSLARLLLYGDAIPRDT
jgi:hypothetical protein